MSHIEWLLSGQFLYFMEYTLFSQIVVANIWYEFCKKKYLDREMNNGIVFMVLPALLCRYLVTFMVYPGFFTYVT